MSMIIAFLNNALLYQQMMSSNFISLYLFICILLMLHMIVLCCVVLFCLVLSCVVWCGACTRHSVSTGSLSTSRMPLLGEPVSPVTFG